MNNAIKRLIKKIITRTGYSLVKNETYVNHILMKAPVSNNIYSKNNLLDNFFKILLEQNFHPQAIYDIGANKGTWTRECVKYFPNATYYLFEPQVNLNKDVEINLKDFKNYHLFNVGVGNANNEINFTIHERDDSCSFSFTEDEAKKNGFKQIKLPVVKLETFVNENKLESPTILKIDAEGLDLEVLEGAGQLINDIEVILIEVGILNKNIVNSALNVLTYLDDKGFRLFDITDINRPFNNRALWLCEFVFIKKDGFLDKDYSKIRYD